MIRFNSVWNFLSFSEKYATLTTIFLFLLCNWTWLSFNKIYLCKIQFFIFIFIDSYFYYCLYCIQGIETLEQGSEILKWLLMFLMNGKFKGRVVVVIANSWKIHENFGWPLRVWPFLEHIQAELLHILTLRPSILSF